MTRTLYDCFLFFNELDMLELRLRELGSVVDRFVLVESAWTFQGKRKPMIFKENQSRFARWADKIIHVAVHDDIGPPAPGDHRAPWWRR